jgi:hypothetical protein
LLRMAFNIITLTHLGIIICKLPLKIHRIFHSMVS